MQYQSLVTTCFTVIYGVLYLPGALLLFLRRDLEPIRSRKYALALFQTFFPVIDMILRAIPISRYSCVVEIIRFFCLIPFWIYPYFVRGFIYWYNCNQQELAVDPTKFTTFKISAIRFIQARKYILSKSFQLGLCTLFFFVLPAAAALIFHFTEDRPGPAGKECQTKTGFYFVAAEGVTGLLYAFFNTYLIWGLKDSFAIKLEFAYNLVIGLPILIVWLVSNVAGWETLFPGLWTCLAMMVFLSGTIYLPLVSSFTFSRRLKRGKAHVSEEGEQNSLGLGTTSTNDLRFILNDEELAKEFERFAIETWCVENLLFYRRVEKFKHLHGSKSLGKEAREICAEFIQQCSPCELNLEMEIRKQILKKVHDDQVSLELFDEAARHAVILLTYSILPLWLTSESYKHVLKKYQAVDMQELKVQRQSKSSSGLSALADELLHK